MTAALAWRLCGPVAALLLAACARSPAPLTPPDDAATSGNAGTRIDFSGYWEKDYGRSDDFNTRFNLYLFDLRRAAARVNSDGMSGASAASSVYGSQEAIMGLARFSEEITRLPRLEITQDGAGILIEREGDYPLRCDWFDQNYAQRSNPFGSELCGWNGEQLLFQTRLDGELSLRHQVTLAPDGQSLNLTTTLQSASVSFPLTVSNYYRRYTPPDQDYHCVLTLSRNKVCSRMTEAP